MKNKISEEKTKEILQEYYQKLGGCIEQHSVIFTLKSKYGEGFDTLLAEKLLKEIIEEDTDE